LGQIRATAGLSPSPSNILNKLLQGIMMKIDPRKFAAAWIDSWNSHNLDRIMAHYSDSFEITTPMIKAALNIDTGTLQGKDAARKYWAAALQKVPDLHFELLDVTEGVGSIALITIGFREKAIEVMFLI
jgi:hypothetical protein